MKKLLLLVVLMSIGLLWGDGSGGGNMTTADIHDRVRNCPAMSTEREGTSNTMYFTTFGLSPAHYEVIQGKPAKLMKIMIENFTDTWTSEYDSLSFNHQELEAYDIDDEEYIIDNLGYQADYRINGQTGCWASPILDEEYNAVYILNKSGMLFSVDTETMTITGSRRNLRNIEKILASGTTYINEYEYMATPLLQRDLAGDYLIIPGIWNVFKVQINNGTLGVPEVITAIGSLTTDDCYMSPAACDYEEHTCFVIVSRNGVVNGYNGASNRTCIIPEPSTKCYFQPTICEDGHFYINTEAAIYSLPVNGRTVNGAWNNEFEVTEVTELLEIENINVCGMERENIISSNEDRYDKLLQNYDTIVPVATEDIIDYSPLSTIQGGGTTYYKLMNNHNVFLQNYLDTYCVYSINNETPVGQVPYSNECYYYNTQANECNIPPGADIWSEFVQSDADELSLVVTEMNSVQFPYPFLTYGTPAAYYTKEDRINIILGDEQGLLWTWCRSLSPDQLGFHPSWINAEGGVYPLYPKNGYSKFMGTPPNVIEFDTIDDLNIKYVGIDPDGYKVYLNSIVRETVLGDYSTAHFDRMMKHSEYSLRIFDENGLVYSNDLFDMSGDDHNYYIPISPILDVWDIVEITYGPVPYEIINIHSGGTLVIGSGGDVRTGYLNIEEGGILSCQEGGVFYTRYLNILNDPGYNNTAIIKSKGYVEVSSSMFIEDNVLAELKGNV